MRRCVRALAAPRVRTSNPTIRSRTWRTITCASSTRRARRPCRASSCRGTCGRTRCTAPRLSPAASGSIFGWNESKAGGDTRETATCGAPGRAAPAASLDGLRVECGLRLGDTAVDLGQRVGDLRTSRFVGGVLELTGHFLVRELERFELTHLFGVLHCRPPRLGATQLQFFHPLLDLR